MATDLQLATQDASDGRFASSVVWGIFLNGAQVLTPDSFVSYEYLNESKISQAPQQGGSFQSYNKVATPFDVRVRMTKGGMAADRASYLADVEAAAASLNLYSVVTPEKTYLNVNIVKLAHRHTAEEGATLLTVDLWFLQVRVSVTAQFYQTTAASTVPVTKPLTTTARPWSADPVVQGTVRTVPFVANNVQDVVNQALQDQAYANHQGMTHY